MRRRKRRKRGKEGKKEGKEGWREEGRKKIEHITLVAKDPRV